MKLEQKIVRQVPILGSSVDPDQLALTIKGFLVGIVPIIIIVSNMFGASLDPLEINSLIDAIVTAVAMVTAAASSVMVVWGLVRKLIVKFKS